MPAKSIAPDFPAPGEGLPYRPCVGIMVVNRDGLVWIGKRDDGNGAADYEYVWQMPQGGIDPGENIHAAALRELYEETSIASVSMIGETAGWLTYDYPPEVVAASRRAQKYRGQAQKWIVVRFEGDESEINILTPPDGHKPEFSEWKWERAERLPALIVPFKRGVYEQVLAEFGDLTA
ncbi:RNA pyrophosphohydrolase [Roseibium sp.]|uniref:RNA pyrophosphohydrolase n=1 Tax=Roseibium sp. TaxID=1936156 RepID=UPI003A9872E2